MIFQIIFALLALIGIFFNGFATFNMLKEKNKDSDDEKSLSYFVLGLVVGLIALVIPIPLSTTNTMIIISYIISFIIDIISMWIYSQTVLTTLYNSDKKSPGNSNNIPKLKLGHVAKVLLTAVFKHKK